MTQETHSRLAGFLWSICNLLRGPYKRNEYRKVILPLTVLRRFDCLLAPTKARVLAEHARIREKPSAVVRNRLRKITGRPFYNLSKLDLPGLLDDPDQLAPNLNAYVHGFSPNVRDVMERFAFDQQIARMAEKNLLYEVIKRFAAVDLSPERVDNVRMGYVFEELIRIGAEQSNEEAGEHFTPREVIKLMVNLLLGPERDLRRSHVVKTIYDPACGTGGMLSVAERYVRDLNADARPLVFGQDWNDEAWAVCKSDMLIKGDDADNVHLGDTFTDDAFTYDGEGRKWTFDYMLANPPFGVEWKQQQRDVRYEAETFGHEGRFGAGLPRINAGSLLFLQHMLWKMRAPEEGGSRIAIVFNGSPLFTGDAGSGESEIRRWIIENDRLEAIVALPDQLFYNTGIATYVWVLTNRKETRRRGKVQLVDARRFFVKMPKSLGNKRNKLGDPADRAGEPDQIADVTRIHGNFEDGETRPFREEDPITKQPVEKVRVVSRVFDNADFGYSRITVERPLRLNFQATPERIARLETERGFVNLAASHRKQEKARTEEIEAGRRRQDVIRELLTVFAAARGAVLYKDRAVFLADLRALADQREVRLKTAETKAILAALGERDETAEVCRDRNGAPEPDPDLRDTENVPLEEDVGAWFRREVAPHVPDAWIDESKTRVGCEIPLNRHFYRYEPPRPLEVIQADIKRLEAEITELLAEVASWKLPPHSTYKPSGVDWLQEIPEHWTTRRLKNVAAYRMSNVDKIVRDDETPVRLCNYTDVYYNDYITAELDLMQATATNEEIGRFGLRTGDVVITKDSEDWTDIGVPALVTGTAPDLVCGYHLAIIRRKTQALDCRYAFRLLQATSINRQLQVAATGVTRYGIPKSSIGDARLPVPPMQEQRAIADFIEHEAATIDKLIAKIEGAVERLREYRSTFIDAATTGRVDVRNERLS